MKLKKIYINEKTIDGERRSDIQRTFVPTTDNPTDGIGVPVRVEDRISSTSRKAVHVIHVPGKFKSNAQKNKTGLRPSDRV